MKNYFFILLIGLLFSCSSKHNFSPRKTNLVTEWDTVRPISNPDKGWYHHLFDNGIDIYLIKNDSDLISFPGMDHLYLRLAWAFLEPEEGKFDWSYIDDVVERYLPMGYGFSFRITCKETGDAPYSVPKKINGVRYATPYWVVKAGAKGIEKPPYGNASWTPDWGDSIFLEKLDNFHKAFAERYDGKPWVRYIDIGSIGEWGEGHTFRSTRIPATIEEAKKHAEIHLKHYKKSQLIVSDGLIHSKRSDEEQRELLTYFIENGISLRDDSPMNPGHMKEFLDTWSVRCPWMFEQTYKTMPNVFELAHYIKVKNTGGWIGRNGEGLLPEFGVTGADVFRNSMKIIRPTYIGFHGYLDEWLTENPELTVELLNLCGYWFFPKSVNTREYKDGNLTFNIEWLNKGVAPAYSVYQLNGKLIPVDSANKAYEFTINDSGNQKWMPDKPTTESYSVNIPNLPSGEYKLAIQLFDTKSSKPVDIGLNTGLKIDEYFIIQSLSF
ncbi:DUF4832 domain-containing protein [Mariniphaga sediminis]|uniref:DUF4832 domain-containing protein n=1 Tax=Mariniphaga sediminis TaxID=1628158 RepID=UPI00356A92A5